MAKGIVIYHSRSGNTQEMAEIITDAMKKAGLDTISKQVADVNIDELLEYDAIVVGSPTYYGLLASEIKKLFDDAVVHHGRLDGKVGGAFASSANVGGGNESTVMSINQILIVNGMIIQGDPQGDHYGPVSIGKPDSRVKQQCIRRGQRIAALTLKLFGKTTS